jgi:hypothetical protein
LTLTGTHRAGEYKQNVKAGLRFLVEQQGVNGALGDELDSHHAFNHAVATLAIAEAYCLTKDTMLRASTRAALRHLYRIRKPSGAWCDARGTDGMEPHADDLLVTSWAISAMTLARDFNLLEDDVPLEAAMQFIEECTRSPSSITASRNGAAAPVREASESVDHASHRPEQSVVTAVGLFSRLHTDRELLRPGNRECVEDGVQSMMRLRPTWETTASSRHNLYEWYYGTCALYLYGGEEWQAWRQAIVPAVTRHQHGNGELEGSWDPQGGQWGEEGGRVYSTALLALTMEVCAGAREPTQGYPFYDYLKARLSGDWLGHPVSRGHRDFDSPPIPVALTFEPNASIPQYAPLDEDWPIGSVDILTGSQRHLAHVYRIRDCRELFGFDGYVLVATESTSRPLAIDAAPGWLITLRTDGDAPQLELGQFTQGGLSQLAAGSTVDWSSLVDVGWVCERRDE